MNPHFLLNARADHVIEFSHAAIVIDPDFGHQEQRYAFGAGRRADNTRQNRMNNVIHQVVLTTGDKNLSAGNGVGAVIIFDRGRGQRAHVGSGLRLGQEHGSRPFAGVHFFQKQFFLFFGPEFLNQFAGAMGQSGIHHKGKISANQIITSSQRHGPGHSLPSPLRVFRHRHPFAFPDQIVHPMKGFRHGNHTVFQFTAFFISDFLGGKHFLDGQVSGFGYDQINRLFIKVSIFFMFAELFNMKLFKQNKIHISSVCYKLCHG